MVSDNIETVITPKSYPEKLTLHSETFHDDIFEGDKNISTWGGLKELPLDTDLFQFVLDTIMREVAAEDGRLAKQVLLVGLSAYTQRPLHLGIGSPTGEGKSYVTNTVLKYFPKGDVISVAGQSNKAFFHEKGEDVVIGEDGVVRSFEDAVGELDDELGAINEQRNQPNITDEQKKELKRREREIEKRYNQLKRDKCKLIDNSGKIRFLQDTPQPEVLSYIMSILSQDSYESEYRYVEAHNSSITTRVNILRGFSTVISCQAIDTSAHPRAAEINRRLIQVNPEMSPKKYGEAMHISSMKFGEPSFVYEEEVVTKHREELTKQAIRYLKWKIKSITKDLSYNESITKIPFVKLILNSDSFPQKRAHEMTAFPRMLNIINISTMINFDKRPKSFFKDRVTVFATLDDLKMGVDFMRDSMTGLRPYILHWYNEVFLRAYEDQKEEVKTITRNDKTIAERKVAVTSDELEIKTLEILHKSISGKRIREGYLEPLINADMVSKDKSEINKTHNIYTPVMTDIDSDAYTPFFEKRSSDFHKSKMKVRNFTSKDIESYVKSNIRAFFKTTLQNLEAIPLYDHFGKIIGVDQFHDIYFHNIGDYFTELPQSSAASSNKEGNITSESQQTTQNDVKSIQNIDNQSKSDAFFSEKVVQASELSTIEQSSIPESDIPDVDRCCPYCRLDMKDSEYNGHILERHEGYPPDPSLDEINDYRKGHHSHIR